MVYQFREDDNKIEEKKNHFQYQAKLRTGIIGFILFLLLSTTTAYKILNLIMNQFNNIEIINEKNEPSIFARFIIAFIIGIVLFIF